MTWSAAELRLTHVQADFLQTGNSSVHERVNDRTRMILESRKMFMWRRHQDGTYHLELSPKGEAALERYNSRRT